MEEGECGAGQDLPEHSLVRSQVGTVVQDLVPGLGAGCLRVEFCDDDGRTNAMASLMADQIMRLHHEPIHEAS